jgi:serine/threonine protein kinase
MGVIWDAESTGPNRRQVVVKEPYSEARNRRITNERLLIETEVLRSINDEEKGPNERNELQRIIWEHVVRYVDHRDSSEPLLVLENVAGITLGGQNGGRAAGASVALHCTLDILQVVDALHECGVIHRDISPSNIMMNPQRGIVLLDFGTSLYRYGELSSKRGNVIQKRGYSAPELLDGKADERSDIFSVGATLFFLLTGKSPGDYMSESHILLRNPTQVNPGVPQHISTLAQSAMAPNPDDRFQSAAAMASELESCLEGGRTSPCVAISGITYLLSTGSVDVGRKHSCDSECTSRGYRSDPQILIDDPLKYVEKHHVRIWTQSGGLCYIEDLQSMNHSAIRTSKGNFEILTPSRRVELSDGDLVALAYSQKRGPYMTFSFHARQERRKV